MSRLIKLELKRNSLKAYFLATIISFIVVLGFTYLIASIPLISGNSADSELFMSYHFIVGLSCVVCMGIFSITAGVMSSKFIVEEYTGKRAILLLSYPINRERILNSKIFLTFFYTIVSMLMCEGMTLGIFFLTEMFCPLCPDKIDLKVVVHSCTLLLYSSVMAGFVGIISLWFGFLRKSISVTIISSCIIVSLLCQVIAQTIAVSKIEYPAIIGIFTVVLVIVILLHRNLCDRVKKMEV